MEDAYGEWLARGHERRAKEERDKRRHVELNDKWQYGILFFENIKESYSIETIYNALRDGALEQTNIEDNFNHDAIYSYLPSGIANYLSDRRVYISIKSIKNFTSTFPPDREIEESENKETLKQSQLDKAACQALARHLWNENPNVSIIDLIRHSSIQKYGNASQYNEKTIRKWLSEVDPRPPEQKTGRPKRA